MPHPLKAYLGDGVYVDWDGYGLVLTTENGIAVTNTIVLEPDVYTALAAYVDRYVTHGSQTEATETNS